MIALHIGNLPPIICAAMPNLKPHTKLALAFDIGTTFSCVSYCIREPHHAPEIFPVARYAPHRFLSIFFTGHRFPSQGVCHADTKVPSVLYYDKTGSVRAAGAEVLARDVIERALTEEWSKAESLVANKIYRSYSSYSSVNLGGSFAFVRSTY